MDPDEAAELWRWYKSGGFEKIAAWLHQRDVAAFNPAAAPLVTEWKLNMVEQGMSLTESNLVDMMQSRVGPFAKGVVGGPFHRVCDAVATALGIPASKVPQAALLHAFKEAGWVDCGRLASGEFKTKKQVFAVKELVSRYSKSELRRMIETVASDGGKVVSLR
jgi:hypothetical protein